MEIGSLYESPLDAKRAHTPVVDGDRDQGSVAMEA